jgi:hypothetical protein
MFVQLYTALFTIAWVGTAFFKHGTLIQEKEYDFRNAFTSLVIQLPILGRVFGWW